MNVHVIARDGDLSNPRRTETPPRGHEFQIEINPSLWAYITPAGARRIGEAWLAVADQLDAEAAGGPPPAVDYSEDPL